MCADTDLFSSKEGTLKYSGYSFYGRPLIEYRQIIIRLTFIRLRDYSNAHISNVRFGYSIKEFLLIR